MSTYHEWFASSAEKITVKNAKTTVRTPIDSFPAKAPWVEPVNEFNEWNTHIKAKADSLLTPAAPSAAETIVKDSIQLDFTLADVEAIPVEIDDEPIEPGYTDMEIIAMAPERMRSIDPNAFLGKVIGPKQFDILAARGRVELFGIECEP
jgi:hypothetical protein